MTTDKAKADKLLAAIAILDEIGLEDHADSLRDELILIVPPKPTWPDGTIAWVTYTHAIEDGHPYQALAQYDADENEWVMERTHTGAACTVTGDNVTTVEPLRVLGDDEIAVSRGPFTYTPELARRYAAELRAANFGVAALLYRRIADALDAEVGDRS